MGDEYAVIARAVRQPLRRWWRRVGSWWVTLGLLLLAAFAAVPLARQQLFGWPGSGLSGATNPFLSPSYGLSPGAPGAPLPYGATSGYGPWDTVLTWIDAANFLIVPLAALLWLAAAWRARSLLAALTAAAPFAGGGPFCVGVRLRLLLVQAAWPLALIALREAALSCRYQLAQSGAAAAPGLLGLAVLKAGGSLELLFFFMLLSCVLLADPPPRGVIGLCWLALFGGWLLFVFAHAGLSWPAVRQLPARDVFEPSLAGLSILHLAGLGLVLLGCYLLWVNRRAGVALLAALAVLRILGTLKLDYANLVPAGQQALKSLVGHGQYALFAITAWEPPVWLEFPTYGDLGSVYLHLLSYSYQLDFVPALCWLVVLGQLALIYAYYQLLRQLLVLGSARRLAAAAQPVAPPQPDPPLRPVDETDHSPETDQG